MKLMTMKSFFAVFVACLTLPSSPLGMIDFQEVKQALVSFPATGSKPDVFFISETKPVTASICFPFSCCFRHPIASQEALLEAPADSNGLRFDSTCDDVSRPFRRRFAGGFGADF